MPKVCIVHTHLGSVPRGNHTTSERWRRLLEKLGWETCSMPEWDGTPCNVMIALHARRSHESIKAFRQAHGDKPLIVVATGTDIYNDEPDRSVAHASFALATRIIVLQPLALDEIPAQDRDRGRVIFQSLDPTPYLARSRPNVNSFDVAFLANARSVKDPLTALRAAQLLPAKSPVRILHMGSLVDSELGAEMQALAADLPAFQSLGSLPQEGALSRLAGCQLALSSSRHEGGANVVTESLALGVPLLASAIPGSIGLLTPDYPGLFPVGDAAGLAHRLHRTATQPAYLQSLKDACQRRAFIAAPALELESFGQLMNEL